MKSNVSDEDTEFIFKKVEEATGSCQQGKYRKSIVLLSIQRRSEELNFESIRTYYEFAKSDPDEWKIFLSYATIHTTSFFRESPHYDLVQKRAKEEIQSGRNFQERPFKVWSSACSTGEEIYSAGLILENLRQENPDFQYTLIGSDLDPQSIAKALKAHYPADSLPTIPTDLHKFILVSTNTTPAIMTIDVEIKKRTKFGQWNLATGKIEQIFANTDITFCRNVLIYFDMEKVLSITNKLVKSLSPTGTLILGHSEALEAPPIGCAPCGNATYRPKPPTIDLKSASTAQSISKRILVVDDSATIRRVLRRLFEQNGYVVDEAGDANTASIKVKNNKYNLITLDINMPGEDGVTWLTKARKNGTSDPVVVVSESRTEEAIRVLGALENGAQDYVLKSQIQENPADFINLVSHLTSTNSYINKEKSSHFFKPFEIFRPDLIAVGASTGGPEALTKLLQSMPPDSPPVLVVQHISANFASAFSERLARISQLKLGLTKKGEVLKEGHIYLSPGDQHLGIQYHLNKPVIHLSDEPKILGHRPAVDFLFHSIAKTPLKTLSILLTGMGRDGANGLLQIHKTNKSITIAQSETSCVVYGMPKEAVLLNAVHFQGELAQIRGLINRCIGKDVNSKLKAS